MLRSHAFLFEENLLSTDAVGTAPPDAFGPFRVLHQIGAGVLGPVFRAYQPEQDRLVAVKLFRLDLPPERVHQLVAELETLIAADLAHPGIAAPIAAGITGVSAYLAQDFVAADSLDIVVRDSTVASAEIVRATTQLASALDVAAVLDITHGALHPRDVLMSSDDVRMTGLGIARALERVGIAAPVRRPYTAPERVAGGPWDRRADVFTLASLVFELLTGKRIAGVGEHAVESMSPVAGADNTALVRVLTRALSEEPADRFATAGDFAKALATTLDPGVRAAARAAVKRRRTEEPAVDVPRFDPMPSEELPLLTDAMLTPGERASQDLKAGPPPFSSVDLDEPPDLRLAPPVDLDASSETEAAGLVDAPAEVERVSIAAIRPIVDVAEPEVRPVVPAPVAASVEMSMDAPIEAPAVDVPMFAEQSSSRSPSGVLPLMLALIVGIAIGFGMAMLLIGSRDRAAEAQAARAAAPTVVRPEELKLPAEPDRKAAPRTATNVPAPATSPARPATEKPPVETIPASKLAPAKAAVEKAPAPPVKPAAPRPSAEVRPAEKPAPVRAAEKPSATARPAARPASKTGPAPPTPPAKTGPGTLVVESRPAGARVLLDGRSMGVTPLVLDSVATGDHPISLELAGYQRWSTSVTISAGERSRVAASLER